MIQKINYRCPGCNQDQQGYLKESTFVCPQCSSPSQLDAAEKEWHEAEVSLAVKKEQERKGDLITEAKVPRKEAQPSRLVSFWDGINWYGVLTATYFLIGLVASILIGIFTYASKSSGLLDPRPPINAGWLFFLSWMTIGIFSQLSTVVRELRRMDQ